MSKNSSILDKALQTSSEDEAIACLLRLRRQKVTIAALTGGDSKMRDERDYYYSERNSFRSMYLTNRDRCNDLRSTNRTLYHTIDRLQKEKLELDNSLWFTRFAMGVVASIFIGIIAVILVI